MKNVLVSGALLLAFMSGSQIANAQNTSYFANTTPVNGTDNCAFGVGALGLPGLTGIFNVAVGTRALNVATTADFSVAVGYQALVANTSGDNNTGVGVNALSTNTTGSNNTGIGSNVLYANTTGVQNAAIGIQTLSANTTGYYNSGMGTRSLALNTTGYQNTGCGFLALATNTIGMNNSSLGAFADVSTGLLRNATAIGANAVVNDSDKVRLGNATVTVVEGPVAYTFSDGRFKTNVKEEDVKGLEFIKKLRPVVYNLDTRKITEFWTKNLPEDVRQVHMSQDFTKSTAVRQSGFIAQEVEKAAKEVNYDFNGVHVAENENDNYSVAYSEFVVPLVKGMQEQQKMIEEQNQMIQKLQQQVNDLVKNQGSTTGLNEVTLPGVSMDQNVPNPFSRETVINFTLPQQVGTAYMTVYDLSGKELKTLPITQRGTSSITVTADQLAAGMYVYSIIADGKIVSSKRMVIADK